MNPLRVPGPRCPTCMLPHSCPTCRRLAKEAKEPTEEESMEYRQACEVLCVAIEAWTTQHRKYHRGKYDPDFNVAGLVENLTNELTGEISVLTSCIEDAKAEAGGVQ